MRLLICLDKFKGSLSSSEAAEAVARGVRSVHPGWELELIPIADGGEGTTQVVCDLFGGTMRSVQVHDALGREVEASYGWIRTDSESWAVMEMSQAAGLWRLASGETNPFLANTYGVGELINTAIRSGASRVCIGLGGSATNDGGSGMAQALGWEFLDANGDALQKLPRDLLHLDRIVLKKDTLSLPEIVVLSDVNNPLLGAQGATAVFGKQKGATSETQPMLERALSHYASVVESLFQKSFREIPGAGAAGGLGFGMLAFCNARIRLGFEWLSEQLNLAAKIRMCDVVITGEGKLDQQTAHGKAPAGILQLARNMGKPVIAFAGMAEETSAFDAAFSLLDLEPRLEYCIENAAMLLEKSAANWARNYPS